jgi:hypothetical protein
MNFGVHSRVKMLIASFFTRLFLYQETPHVGSVV